MKSATFALIALSALRGRSVYAQVGGNGLCPDPASLGPDAATAGGYSPVDELSASGVTDAAQAATVEYFSANNDACVQEVLAACGNPSPEEIAESVDVSAACSQVVAGTNYKVAFSVTIPCSDADKKKLDGTAQLTPSFEAEVFEPLPSDNGGEGQTTTVNTVEVTDGECTGVKATPYSPFPVIGGNGLCPDPASLGPNAATAGGYSPVEVPSEDATKAAWAALAKAGEAAAKKIWNADSTSDEGSCYDEVIAVCGATEEDFINSVVVTAACSQVVAGTNFKLAFTTTIPCDREGKAKLENTAQLTQTWEAEVFVPLPSDDSSDEEIKYKETSGTCAGVKETPVLGAVPDAPLLGAVPDASAASGVTLSAAVIAGATVMLLV